MTVKYGLGDSPDPIYLFVSESVGEDGEIHPWHMFDHDAKKAIPVKDRALTGIITGLRMKMTQFKEKEAVKLQVTIAPPADVGGQPYVVQSGVETTFTRGILLALDLVDDYTQPLTLVVANGGEKVVFGRLHRAVSGERIKVMWDKERKIFPLIQQLQKKLGQRPQSWADVQETLQRNAPPSRDDGRNGDEAPDFVDETPESPF